MGVFIVLYIFLLLVWFVSNSLPEKQRAIFVCLNSFLGLWLIQALRADTIGLDLVNYIPMFNDSALPSASEGVEKGFGVFNYLIHNYISTDYNVYLSIVSLMILLPFTLVVDKYSKIPALSFIIFTSFVLYVFSFSALRQTIAIGITTWSFLYVEKKKLIPFVCLVLLASSFHATAIIFTIVYPLCNYVKFTKKIYIIALAAMAVLTYSLSSFLDFLLPYIFEENRYSFYYIELNATPAYNLLIIIAALFALTFIVRKPDKLGRDMQVMLFLSLCCQCLGLISPTAPRIGFYFFIFIGIAIANIIAECRMINASKQLMKIGITAFMIFFFFYSYSGGYLNVIPYKFFWE